MTVRAAGGLIDQRAGVAPAAIWQQMGLAGKGMERMSLGRRRARALVMAVAAATATLAGMGAPAQTTAGQGVAARPSFTLPTGGFNTPRIPDLPPAKPITPDGTVVEDVIARVNDQVITRTEYERAEQGLVQEAKQENWSPTELADKQHTLLRDMIDQQLLLSKGKELGITGDAETLRQLDEMRKRANLPDMDALEKAAAEQGISFEDFKQNIRNQVITQQVVRDEVGRRIGSGMTPSAEQAYYKAHEKDFEQPEQVHLSEILVPTPDNATDAQISTAQTKADELEARLKAGGKFAELAKTASGGPTAAAGGDLGDFKRGMLGDVLEKATFPLPVGGYTEPIRTRQGFVILKVDSHQQAGVPPLSNVENQVQEGLYMSQLQPALRSYLTQARQDAYVEIKPGFTDVGSAGADGHTTFTAYTPPPLKRKTVKKQRAEQLKAEKAEQQLAAAREKVAERQQAKEAAHGGLKNAGFTRKSRKIKREKVRFGQAPRNALPNGTAETTAVVPSLGAATEGSDAHAPAPGSAIAAATEPTAASITTGVSAEDANPLDTQAEEPEHKTRFASRQSDSEEKRAEKNLSKAEVKSTKRPPKPTPAQSTEEKVASAPLGLSDAAAGKTPKPKKPRRDKGQPKERLQEKPKPAEPTNSGVSPTVNPALGASAVTNSESGVNTSNPTRPVSGTSDQTTLPPPSAAPAGAPPQGQPIPAATGTQSNPATTTVPQPQ